MFYDFVKLPISKELKDIKNKKCIIISQQIIDYSSAYMFMNKNVRFIINCTDDIYETEALRLLKRKKINVLFLPEYIFQEIGSSGKIYINNSCIIYNHKIYSYSIPGIISPKSFIDGFVENTLAYMQQEIHDIKKVKVTGIYTKPGAYALIISRGYYTYKDVIYAKNVIKRYKPTVIAVDGGADSAINYGIFPDVVIGDMDSISKNAVKMCSNFIVHCYKDGRCPGKNKIPEDLNKNVGYIYCTGTSEDAALHYCITGGVSKIYTLGYHTTSLDFIEKGRKGMSSSILIRMYYGHMITDIKDSIKGDRVSYFPAAAAVILFIIYASILFTLAVGVFK